MHELVQICHKWSKVSRTEQIKKEMCFLCDCRDGQKMSKRKKNYPDPLEVVHKYGADALR